MKTLEHYGKVVFYEQFDTSYTEVLKKNNITYVELPILSHKVIAYSKNSTTYFAVIEYGNSPDTYLENVYVTREIPLDMSWQNLVNDVRNQLHGEKPAKMKTKAKLLCEKAEELTLEGNVDYEKNFFEQFDRPLSSKQFRLALSSLGYSIEDLLEMEHYDVDEEFLKSMKKE